MKTATKKEHPDPERTLCGRDVRLVYPWDHVCYDRQHTQHKTTDRPELELYMYAAR